MMQVLTAILLSSITAAYVCKLPVGREVIVHVSIHTETDVPLRGIGFEIRGCIDGVEQYYGASTDSDGECVIEATVCQGMTVAYMKAWIPRANGFEDDHAVYLEARSNTEEWGIEAVYRIDIPEEGGALVDIVAPRAVSISGRLVDEQGLPAWGIVGRVGGMLARASDEQGLFTTPGVPAEMSTWVYVAFENAPAYSVWHVDAALLDQDMDVGDVVIVPRSEDAQLSVQVLGWQAFDVPTVRTTSGPVILRDDLSVALQSYVSDTGMLIFGDQGDETSVGLPVGKYYVIPGSFHWSEEVAWVLDAIERDDPALTQLPFVELEAGDSKHIQVDYAPTLETIRTLFGPP